MNALDPIRHAYGDAAGPPPAPGEPGYAEYEALRSTRAALDALPRVRPDASVLDAVAAAAAAEALRAVEAACGEAEAPVETDRARAEYDLHLGTLRALDTLPAQRPDASVLAAIAAASGQNAGAYDPLAPVRHAVGEGEGAAPVPGTPAYVEFELLRSTLDALDTLPAQRPDAAVLGAVARAASAETRRAVQAACGEAEPPPADDCAYAEYTLLRDTLHALDTLPAQRPDASVLAALTAAAKAAVTASETEALDPLRHALGEAEGAAPASGTPAFVEYETLRSTLAALDALPRERPDPSVLAAVASAASAQALRAVQAAYGEVEPPAADTAAHAEYELLASTRDVLNRAPRSAPDTAILAAITAAAAEATGSAPIPPLRAVPAGRAAAAGASVRPANDRPARERVRGSRRIPAWVGTAAMLVVVAVTGLWMLNERPPEDVLQDVADAGAPEVTQPQAPQATEDAEGIVEEEIAAVAPDAAFRQEQITVPDASVILEGPFSTEPVLPPPPRDQASTRASTNAATPQRSGSGLRPSPSAPPPAPPPPPPDVGLVTPLREAENAITATEERFRDALGVRTAARAETTMPAGWEAGDDVRLLSLRLQQLAETSDGLDWDAPPSPFGMSSEPGAGLPGVQPVRGGAEPARIDVRMRTTPSDRSSGQ